MSKPESNGVAGQSLSTIINSRQTDELVIAVCGPLGSGYDQVAKHFQKIIERQCNYTAKHLSLSKIIATQSSQLINNGEVVSGALPESKRIERLQSLGNRLRSQYGNDILAQFAVKQIAIARQEHLKSQDKLPEELISRRYVTIVESLKHPDEYTLFSRVYGKMFYLVGVLCPEKMREDRLTKKPKGMSREDAARLIERDRGEDDEFGQQLLKTIQHADFFVSNTTKNVTKMPKTIERFIKLILGSGVNTPTTHEYAMHAAHSAAMRSGCMSRQVGAAIVNRDGDLISTGRNDVPCPGGGLYSENFQGVDSRCMTPAGGSHCRSDVHKKHILNKISEIITDHMQDKGDICIHKLSSLYSQINRLSELRGLIEFSRSVHAEMDAITTVARTGLGKLQDAILYCTTFPCHHCTRHIVASGIRKVYYIEPYEKSLATTLHDDSIVTEIQDDEAPSSRERISQVYIVPFEGVAPKQFINLFTAKERKRDGSLVEIDMRTAKPVVEKFMDTYKEYEEKVTDFLHKQLERAAGVKKLS